MGRRFWLGVGILILFLALGLAVTWGMEAIHAPAEQALAQAAQKALAGQMEEAVILARQAQTRWDTYHTVVASMADHTPMDDVDKLFAEMEIYAQSGEAEHFAVCCAQLKRLVRSMSDVHALSWWNFL